MLNIIGISGSPVKDGNVEMFLQTMLMHAEERGARTTAINLSRLHIADCNHCNFCLKRQKAGKYCAQEDDVQGVYELLETADIIVLASPVYFMRLSGQMASFVDRLRVFVFGNIAGGSLKNKIGISAAVAWARHGGFETTHLTHITAFLTLEMLPVSVHHCISPLGASAVASQGGTGFFDKAHRHGVTLDEVGLHSGRAMIERGLELARLVKR